MSYLTEKKTFMVDLELIKQHRHIKLYVLDIHAQQPWDCTDIIANSDHTQNSTFFMTSG